MRFDRRAGSQVGRNPSGLRIECDAAYVQLVHHAGGDYERGLRRVLQPASEFFEQAREDRGYFVVGD
jgi:hypothetical protein